MSSTAAGLAQVGVLLLALAVAHRPFGDYLARVHTDTRHLAVERAVYRVAGVDPASEQRWGAYARSVLAFSFAGVVLLYLLQRLQPLLPFDFDRGAVPPAVAFNTAISFVTNTNWQSYVPEVTLGHAVQMAGLTAQNFVSGAVGLSVAMALVRGFTRQRTDRLGNFWVDLVRGTTRVLLPVAFLFAVVLVATGVVMSLRPAVTVDGVQVAIAPVASQEAIKVLGTNGGGVFNANSAHPFENPTGWSNLIQVFLILLIPVSLTRAFGTLVGDRRQGRVLLGVVGALWAGVLAVVWAAEAHGLRPLEGKELRFGIPSSALFANTTTATSTGAVNSMHDSYTGLGGGAVLLNMLFGEMTPGGVGTGLYGILVMAVIALFLAGLMVGRTPEYLGKKLGRREVTAAALSILAVPAVLLTGAGVAAVLPGTPDALGNPGEHGLTGVLYAYASASNNNGSAFAGLTATGDWFQVSLGICMALGRFVPIAAVLCLAGSLAAQRTTPATAGTLPTAGPLFATLLAGSIVLVAALTYVPALALGPIAEALL
ncbi:potassium-transporting ATPase subunit KdpA [Saccharothrix algeriensis]|uniref:Potassium-transporting ATPase potassium-binding subunit n=1 Tax=Saccharothrix algeriensis TaxID=173560 RepID=A0A8T8HZ07_9PSEU|nr:potassium-transporting ATPase subunit KdpA [Saccharothrix algeriensis]MBM7809266.1 K+-transporting ATPase ATPase A chain [Saccharothrix algeriensis]QTR03617.1 potassium-transporting ATPase subunit KdpA [Saccharothrix algeriensis]